LATKPLPPDQLLETLLPKDRAGFIAIIRAMVGNGELAYNPAGELYLINPSNRGS
jgi:hypothetical protein